MSEENVRLYLLCFHLDFNKRTILTLLAVAFLGEILHFNFDTLQKNI